VIKGKLSFIKELAGGGLLPTHSEQEIRDHETWFQEYQHLNDRKKEVIQKWREKKEVNTAAVVAHPALLLLACGLQFSHNVVHVVDDNIVIMHPLSIYGPLEALWLRPVCLSGGNL